MALNQLLRLNCIDNCHAIEVDIYSPWEAALAFTLSSFTGLVLVNQWVLGSLPDNPFTLYFSELAICFLAVTTCAPLLVGSSQDSTRWHALVAFASVIGFGALCLAEEIVIYRWGLHWRCIEPYGVVVQRRCKAYVTARLAGRASVDDLPVPLPAAVLVQVAGVGSFMAMLVLQMGYLGYVRYNELRLLAVALLRPIEPLFKLAGAPLPTDTLDFAMPRTCGGEIGLAQERA
eukprot:g24130.t1